jgi:phage/plasmid-like protein (TIGR03299 family)
MDRLDTTTETGTIVVDGNVPRVASPGTAPDTHHPRAIGRSATVAHELETLANGQTAFASARLTAWHQLGQVTADCMTAEEIMRKAWLGGWEVRKIALQGIEITDAGITKIDCPDKFMTVRTNPQTGATEYLGVVGEDYTTVQNEQVAEVLNLLVDESGAHFETAGSMRKGKNVFVTMKLPEGMTIAGVDKMDLYLAATTSHDGTASLRLDATPVRIVCANTQRLAYQQSRASYTFRHTSNVGAKISEARQALGLMWTAFAEFEADAERMLNEQLTMGEFEKIVAQLWPVTDDATDTTRNNAKQRTATLRYLIRDADTQKAIKGSRWAGYQAITEYLDHFAPAKTDLVRATRALTGAGAEIKSRAFELLAV